MTTDAALATPYSSALSSNAHEKMRALVANRTRI